MARRCVREAICASFAQYAAYEAAVAGGDEPILTVRADVSSEFFTALEVQPVLGRSFVPDEHRLGAAPAALVSYSYWQRYCRPRPVPP